MTKIEVGTLYRDLKTSKIYVFLGYTIMLDNIRYVFSYVTQFFIGPDFIYNNHFNIDGYFEELKDSILGKEIVSDKLFLTDSLNNFELLDQNVYEFKSDLFIESDIKLWFMKSKIAGAIEFNLFFTIDNVEHELEHISDLKKEKKKRELEEKLSKLDLLSKSDLRLGNVYNNPINDDKLLYLGKNNENSLIFIRLNQLEFAKLNSTDETKVYQAVLKVLKDNKDKAKKFKKLPKLEKESVLFVPLYTYESSLNFKLLYKKYGF